VQTNASLEQFDIKSLFEGASTTSFKQTINVQRLEDEILNSLPLPPLIQPESVTSQVGDAQLPKGVQSPLDYTMIDEQIDLEVKDDGRALLTARVRSEKVTPLLGTEVMYKKSALIITKILEVDLTVTPQRRSLHELLMIRLNVGNVESSKMAASSGYKQTKATEDLTQDEKKQIYRVFLGLAELYKCEDV